MWLKKTYEPCKGRCRYRSASLCGRFCRTTSLTSAQSCSSWLARATSKKQAVCASHHVVVVVVVAVPPTPHRETAQQVGRARRLFAFSLAEHGRQNGFYLGNQKREQSSLNTGWFGIANSTDIASAFLLRACSIAYILAFLLLRFACVILVSWKRAINVAVRRDSHERAAAQ